MEFLLTFLLAFIWSFVGSIPPGTLNLSILQLAINQQLKVAMRFAVAASLIEYPYAWLAVSFEELITQSPVVVENFKLITATVMITMGILTLISSRKPTSFSRKFESSGFRRGIILSILNPLALPYWVAMTAYMKAQGWITLSTMGQLQAYLLGVVAGACALLALLALLAQRLVHLFQPQSWIRQMPAFILLVLGIYALTSYLLQ